MVAIVVIWTLLPGLTAVYVYALSVIVHATFACLRTISCRRYVELSVGSAASAVGRYVSEAISGCELSSRLSRSQTIDR